MWPACPHKARRYNQNFAYVAAWEYNGAAAPDLHKQPLDFEAVEFGTRSYK